MFFYDPRLRWKNNLQLGFMLDALFLAHFLSKTKSTLALIIVGGTRYLR